MTSTASSLRTVAMGLGLVYAGRAITVLVIGGISVMGYLGLVFMALTGAAINIASGAALRGSPRGVH